MNVSIELRDYQREMVQSIYDAHTQHRGVLAVMPTGSGKTVTFSHILSELTVPAAVIVHRREIVNQISLSLARFGIKHRAVVPRAAMGIIRRSHYAEFGKTFLDDNAKIGVASVQTLTSRSVDQSTRMWVNRVKYCVFDEGHHYVQSGTWDKSVSMLRDDCKLLFVTATPERTDGRGLGTPPMGNGYSDIMLVGPTVRELIDSGRLSEYKYYAPETDLNVESLGITKSGDFNSKKFRERVVESHLVGDCVKHYNDLLHGKRALIFATDIETSREIAGELGDLAVALDGTTDIRVRNDAILKFSSGEIKILVNVDLFDEGFDVPACAGVILARPTMSLGKYLQMVGRALRPAPGKQHAIVVDAVRNWERHGLPDWPRVWTLENQEKRATRNSNGEPELRLRVCLGCTQPYPIVINSCPYCGLKHVPPSRDSIECVEGDVQQLDVELFAELFERQRIASMSDDEFMQHMIKRRVPEVGQRAHLKRHRAARTRRDVLDRLLSIWKRTRCEGFDDSQINKMFFLSFDVDIITARSLNAEKTDELIKKIIDRGFTRC